MPTMAEGIENVAAVMEELGDDSMDWIFLEVYSQVSLHKS